MKLASVWLPRALRGFDSDAAVFDVTLADGRVSTIEAVATPARGTLLSALVDLHVHMDKNYVVHEVGPARGDLFAAIERMAAQRERWSGPDLHARMTRALEDAYACGSRALRTHLDWDGPEAPLALGVLQTLREAWRGRIELQFVSLTPLDRFADAAASAQIAQQVAQAGGLLGAFVYRNAELAARLERVFELAVAHDLDLDFHVDEGLDADAEGLREIAALTLTHGWHGRVTCGHACSLSVQPAAQARATLVLCRAAGIHLVALPTTNAYLQGSWAGTPVERGVTRLNEAATLGMCSSIATDNVADAFYPYGSYDLLETFGLGVQLAHLAPAADWLDAITVSPARAMGLAWDGRIAPGCPADLVLLAATSESELLSPRGRQRRVIRAGHFVESAP